MKIEELQKEIKDVYSLFKCLIEKGLPHFWDEDNCLLKKEDCNNLLVQKRNYHSQFENLEGNLGEVMVEKFGDTFDLFNQVRQVNFPSPLIEEYIDLEIEAQQLEILNCQVKVISKKSSKWHSSQLDLFL